MQTCKLTDGRQGRAPQSTWNSLWVICSCRREKPETRGAWGIITTTDLISFTHPRAHLCPCGLPVTLPPPWGWQTGRAFGLPLALPQIALVSAWFEIKKHLLVTLPSLPFFSTACSFLFLLYALYWYPRRRLLWKSSQWVKVVVKRDVAETESLFQS